MCGIVGVLGEGNVVPKVLKRLKALEYRGYDSAGIAIVEKGEIELRRAAGKLSELEALMADDPMEGATAIGHTRWATHGAPTQDNAHPHVADKVAVIHNGIIENHLELRAALEAKGEEFRSETDTEVVLRLVSHRLGSTNISPEKAVKESIAEVRGAFALAFVFADDPDLLIVARRGSPLVVGTNGASTFAGSDAHALAGLATELTYLEDGDIAVLRRASIKIYDGNGELVERPSRPATAADAYIDKGVHRHFMAKEIFEQPEVIGHTFGRYIDPGSTSLRSLKEVHGENVDLSSIDRLLICACGTAFYAGLTAKYWFESLAGLNVEADIASEVRYRDIPYREGGAALFISQSGETADTMAALAQAKSHGQQIIGVVNVPDSSIARESHINFPTLAGVEVGVASTKAFTCQLATLACLVIHAGRQRNALTAADERKLVTELLSVPRLVAEALQVSSAIDAVAKKLAKARDVLYIGRGVSYPSAMEGALKLKEISYIHAESYAAGELKHGPIALVDENTPVIAVAPSDRHFEKTMSNLQEVVARGARAIVITDNDGKAHAEKIADDVIITPKGTALTAPIVNAVPLQLLAYHTAVAKGTDVDQPRNLAKSVTVE